MQIYAFPLLSKRDLAKELWKRVVRNINYVFNSLISI